MRFISFILIVTALYAAVPAAGQASDTRGLIELALDEPTRITLTEIKLSDAIQTIWDQTGVRVVMPAEAMNLVPYGGETVIERVEISDIPLREGLNRLFMPLGMTFEVRDNYVEIVPKDALRCLGRRPTWEELDTLGELAAMQPGVDPEALSRLQHRVQFTVRVSNGWATLSNALKSVRAGPGDEVLSVACANLGWAWCVSGGQVVISSGASLLRQQLGRPISLRMNYKSLIEVLQEVGRKAGVSVKVEPGALASLPLNVQRSFILNVHNNSAEEVLDTIAANTGLGYLIEPDGVLFYKVGEPQPQSEAGSVPASAGMPGRDPYVGKIVTQLKDGKTVEWLIRESELPPDLRERRREDLQEAFEALRRPRSGQGP